MKKNHMYIRQLNKKFASNSNRRMSDSIYQLSSLLKEKEEEFPRKQIGKFCNLLKEARQSEEVNTL